MSALGDALFWRQRADLSPRRQRAFAGRLRTKVAAIEALHPGVGIALSRLSWLECRVGPVKASDGDRLALFDTFFARSDLTWIELSSEVVELAAAIRVRHGLRTPDALQAASCLQLGPQHMLITGDVVFQRVEGLEVIVLT